MLDLKAADASIKSKINYKSFWWNSDDHKNQYNCGHKNRNINETNGRNCLESNSPQRNQPIPPTSHPRSVISNKDRSTRINNLPNDHKFSPELKHNRDDTHKSRNPIIRKTKLIDKLEFLQNRISCLEILINSDCQEIQNFCSALKTIDANKVQYQNKCKIRKHAGIGSNDAKSLPSSKVFPQRLMGLKRKHPLSTTPPADFQNPNNISKRFEEDYHTVTKNEIGCRARTQFGSDLLSLYSDASSSGARPQYIVRCPYCPLEDLLADVDSELNYARHLKRKLRNILFSNLTSDSVPTKYVIQSDYADIISIVIWQTDKSIQRLKANRKILIKKLKKMNLFDSKDFDSNQRLIDESQVRRQAIMLYPCSDHELKIRKNNCEAQKERNLRELRRSKNAKDLTLLTSRRSYSSNSDESVDIRLKIMSSLLNDQ